MGIIGIIANPASGKDIRRLVARASVFDNQEKQAIIRRALAGIAAADGRSCQIAYFDDAHAMTRGALAAAGDLAAEPVACAESMSALDTVNAAKRLRALGSRVIVTLGGDGTNRAVAAGWQDAPLIPISTGTNNVFPRLVEGTVAGAAAGLIGSGRIPLEAASAQAKLIRMRIEGEDDDLALIDAVLSSERFVGSRALLAPERLKYVLLARADPAAVGMTALGGLLQPVTDAEDGGLLLTLGAGITVNAPIAPGYYRPVRVTGWRTVAPGERVVMEGPGVLAFDGERERVLREGQQVHMTIERTGPRVVNLAEVLRLAAEEGAFRLPADVRDDGYGRKV